MTLPELIGGRLYTGPMYASYNAVLRGKDSAVPVLREQFESICLGNTYTTTLHAINSLLVKMSKLTIADKVYRGVAGGVLPESFLEPNEFHVRGGIESGFMSTTRDRQTALHYASSGGQKRAGLIFEIQARRSHAVGG